MICVGPVSEAPPGFLLDREVNTLEQTIGNTPLVKLQRMAPDNGSEIWVKLEGNNPAGSVKDRAALSMIVQAEKRGEIKPGDVLIEATSGNTGIALAMIAALKIVFIYSVLGMEFTTETFFLTMLIAVLSAIIVGGVPGGAFLGEIFIVTTLGLPMEAIPMLVVLGTITDAPATLINVIHDLNAAQIVERFAGKKPMNADINTTDAVVPAFRMD